MKQLFLVWKFSSDFLIVCTPLFSSVRRLEVAWWQGRWFSESINICVICLPVQCGKGVEIKDFLNRITNYLISKTINVYVLKQNWNQNVNYYWLTKPCSALSLCVEEAILVEEQGFTSSFQSCPSDDCWGVRFWGVLSGRTLPVGSGSGAQSQSTGRKSPFPFFSFNWMQHYIFKAIPHGQYHL